MTKGNDMSRLRGYLCGVPENECTGHAFDKSRKFRASSNKGHSSRREAKACYVHWLKTHGWVQSPDNASEFIDPNGGPHLIITKQSRFGGELRAGKEKRLQHKNLKGTAT